MNTSAQHPDFHPRDVCRLASRALDGAGTDEELVHLEQLLTASASAREVYYRVIDLHAELAWALADKGSESGVKETGSPLLYATPDVAPPAVPAVSEVERREVEGSSTQPVSHSPRRSLALSSLTWSILAASLLFAGYFVVISWNMLGRERSDRLTASSTNGADATVATITASEDAQWSPDRSPLSPGGRGAGGEGADITKDSPLSLQSGLVELQLKQGTTLVVKGPAEWTIDDQNRVTLKRGTTIARVPPSAVGFTMVTPSAKVVDLGTEFVVAVTPTGQTDVHVTQGKVDLSRIVDTQPRDEAPATLVAGDTARVLADGSHPRRIALEETAIASLTDKPWFTKSQKPLKTIWLGNLFDDADGVSLAEAMRSDEFRARAETGDLAIDRVAQAGSAIQEIAPGIRLDLSSVGWEHAWYGHVVNDAWTDEGTSAYDSGTLRGGLRTRGSKMPGDEPKCDEGIGMHANALLTFDLDRLRAAGGFSSEPMTFISDRAGINDDCIDDAKSSVHLLVIVCSATGVQKVLLNGEAVKASRTGNSWTIDTKIGPPLRADGNFARFRVRIPAGAKYLTLAATSAGDYLFMDHAVWSGARIEIEN